LIDRTSRSLGANADAHVASGGCEDPVPGRGSSETLGNTKVEVV